MSLSTTVPPPPHPPPPSSSPPPQFKSIPKHLTSTTSLYKQKSWSPDSDRDEAWQRRKGNYGLRRSRRSKSVTDDDLDELKACIELGFGFDSPEMDQRLSDTLPAYGLYYAVHKQYNDVVSKTSSTSDCDTPSPLGSPLTIFGPGDNPQAVKTKLKQWARVVGCAVRQS